MNPCGPCVPTRVYKHPKQVNALTIASKHPWVEMFGAFPALLGMQLCTAKSLSIEISTLSGLWSGSKVS